MKTVEDWLITWCAERVLQSQCVLGPAKDLMKAHKL